MNHSKTLIFALVITSLLLSSSCGAKMTATVNNPSQPAQTQDSLKSDIPVLTIDSSNTHQTWEGFGTSSCWWSQYVGSWDEPAGDIAVPVREQIAKWLYSRDEGIGLNIYRYNVGAGSADSGLGDISDSHRRAHSFLLSNGEYDWDNDEYAVWFMRRCVELGANEVVFFCNSPPEYLTLNGMAHMTDGGTNLTKDKYGAFADYLFDIAEHFRDEGIPVTMLSPINEPQWQWKDGQEGCHYSADEVAAVLKEFVKKLNERGLADKYTITAPEAGEWGGVTKLYVNEILADEELRNYFKTLDIHSYWSILTDKVKFKTWLDTQYPGTSLTMSEWCEMVNGKDYTMDSAFNMSDVIWEDITALDVISWQYWVGVADGDYRDGLIYVDVNTKTAKPNRRLWGFGNYTKFIRPGFVRIDYETGNEAIDALHPVLFTGKDDDGKEKCVIVLTNRGEELALSLAGFDHSKYAVYVTSMTQDLELTASGAGTADSVTIPAESIVTIVMDK